MGIYHRKHQSHDEYSIRPKQNLSINHIQRTVQHRTQFYRPNVQNLQENVDINILAGMNYHITDIVTLSTVVYLSLFVHILRSPFGSSGEFLVFCQFDHLKLSECSIDLFYVLKLT